MIEEWRKVDGFPEYSISSAGRVRRDMAGSRTHAGRILKGFSNGHGYLHVGLCRNGKMNTRRVHRLVAEAFVDGRTETRSHVNHIDGDKKNNAVSNLEWCTSSENTHHAKINGILAFGERNGASKLDPEKIAMIRRLCEEGGNQHRIAEAFRISSSLVSQIFLRKLWANGDQ